MWVMSPFLSTNLNTQLPEVFYLLIRTLNNFQMGDEILQSEQISLVGTLMRNGTVRHLSVRRVGKVDHAQIDNGLLFDPLIDPFQRNMLPAETRSGTFIAALRQRRVLAAVAVLRRVVAVVLRVAVIRDLLVVAAVVDDEQGAGEESECVEALHRGVEPAQLLEECRDDVPAELHAVVEKVVKGLLEPFNC